MPSWVCPREAGPPTFEFLCYLDVPGDVDRKELFEDGDLIVFTDGSLSVQKLSFSFVIYRDADCISPVFEYNALLTFRKTILDAEATALVCGLDVVLALPYSGKIFLISNCRTALRILSASPAPGPLSSVRTGARGAPNFPGPRAKSPPRPAPRGGAGHLSDRAGRGGASFLAPRLIPRSGAPLFTGPRPVHRRNFVAYLPIAPFFLRF